MMSTPTHERATDAAKHSSFIGYFSTMLSENLLETSNLWTASIFLYLLTAVAKGALSIRDFVQAKNKNLTGLSKLLFNTAVGAGALLLMGVFIIAPLQGWAALYFTIFSINVLLGVEAILNGCGAIYHLAQAFLAPANSIERKQFLQASLSSANKAIIAASVLTLLLVPFSLPVTFALTAAFVGYLGANIVWHLVPPFRNLVKKLLHLAKPVEDMTLSPTLFHHRSNEKERTPEDIQHEAKYHNSLFVGRAYRKKVVYDYLQAGAVDKACSYLKEECMQKIAHYESLPLLNQKQLAKKNCIEEALALLNKPNASSLELQAIIDKWTDKHIHQSFFAETADTIDLLGATGNYLRDYSSFSTDKAPVSDEDAQNTLQVA